MKKALLMMAMVVIASAAHGETFAIKYQPKTECSMTGYEFKNRDALVAFLEGQISILGYRPSPALIITLSSPDTGDAKSYVVKKVEDLPQQSVRADCPKSEAYEMKNCWFIKYRDDDLHISKLQWGTWPQLNTLENRTR